MREVASMPSRPRLDWNGCVCGWRKLAKSRNSIVNGSPVGRCSTFPRPLAARLAQERVRPAQQGAVLARIYSPRPAEIHSSPTLLGKPPRRQGSSQRRSSASGGRAFLAFRSEFIEEGLRRTARTNRNMMFEFVNSKSNA